MCWISSKTGKPVPLGMQGHFIDKADPNHAYNPVAGENYVKLPDGTWINSKTGKPVPLGMQGHFIDKADPNHAYNPVAGENYVKVPCPNPGMKFKSKKTSGLRTISLRPTKTMMHQEMSPIARPMLMPHEQKCGNGMMGGGLAIGGNCKMK